MTKLIHATPPQKRPGLLEISRDVMARTPEGKEALIAMKAVQDWKSSAAVRGAHGDLASYHDVLVELHEAGTLKLKGENFMNTGKIDGADYGQQMHVKWVATGKPGSFQAFIENEKKREVFENTPGLKEQFGSFENYRERVEGKGAGGGQ